MPEFKLKLSRHENLIEGYELITAPTIITVVERALIHLKTGYSRVTILQYGEGVNAKGRRITTLLIDMFGGLEKE